MGDLVRLIVIEQEADLHHERPVSSQRQGEWALQDCCSP